MRIVVIEGTEPIGSRLVTTLRDHGHQVVAAAPETCFNALTGEGLDAVLEGADVVVDLSDPPFVGDDDVVPAFTTAARNLLEHEYAAGVAHHVALVPVRSDRLLASGYYRARLGQEQLIRHFPIPYSIVRTTPLFESLTAIADVATQGSLVRVPPVPAQPVAAGDVARLISTIAMADPLNGAIEVGGPEPFYLDALVERVLGARNDPRGVVADALAHYAGARLDERSLVAGEEAELGETRFDDWLRETVANGQGSNGHGRVAALQKCEFRVGDVPPGSVLLVADVAVFSVAGGLCATQAMCTHRAGPLSEGVVNDTTVTCPLHGAQFDVWTGAVLRGPAKVPLETYRVVVEGDVGRVFGG